MHACGLTLGLKRYTHGGYACERGTEEEHARELCIIKIQGREDELYQDVTGRCKLGGAWGFCRAGVEGSYLDGVRGHSICSPFPGRTRPHQPALPVVRPELGDQLPQFENRETTARSGGQQEASMCPPGSALNLRTSQACALATGTCLPGFLFCLTLDC